MGLDRSDSPVHEQEAAFDTINVGVPSFYGAFGVPAAVTAMQQPIATLKCPSDLQSTTNSYRQRIIGSVTMLVATANYVGNNSSDTYIYDDNGRTAGLFIRTRGFVLQTSSTGRATRLPWASGVGNTGMQAGRPLFGVSDRFWNDDEQQHGRTRGPDCLWSLPVEPGRHGAIGIERSALRTRHGGLLEPASGWRQFCPGRRQRTFRLRDDRRPLRSPRHQLRRVRVYRSGDQRDHRHDLGTDPLPTG